MPPDDEPDEGGFSRPLPPEDRIWRHPSELGPPTTSSPPTRPPAAVGTTDVAPHPSSRTLLLALVSAIVGAGATLVVLTASGTFDERTATPAVEQVQISVPANPNASELALGDQVYPAVVQVQATGVAGARAGTGVVFRSDGHLLTSADAVDGATTIAVTFVDGTTVPGRLVGMDRPNDIAVVDVDGDQWPMATLTADPSADLGDRMVVLSAGRSWPDHRHVGVGLVSGLGQQVPVSGGDTLHGMIQANISVEHDATGAALVDTSGAVVGLVTRRGVASDAKASKGNTLEVRYATPITWAKHLADEIIADGRTEPVWLGVEGTDVSDAEVDDLGGRGGAKLTAVIAGSPATAAGLQVGDIVTSINGVAVTSMSELIVSLRPLAPGDVVRLAYLRAGTAGTAQTQLARKGAN